MFSSPIIPAIIPRSVAEVGTLTARLARCPELHLDVVDGQFVPYTSWPYNTNEKPIIVKALLDVFSLEVDLMVVHQIEAATEWIAAGADQLVFHVEAITLETFKSFTEAVSVSIGVAATNNTPLDTLCDYVPYADYVQVMGIAAIGAQGQAFDERAITRIEMLQQRFPQVALSIDGGVNATTVPRLFTLPLQRYIIGSAIVQQSNAYEAYQTFTQQFLDQKN